MKTLIATILLSVGFINSSSAVVTPLAEPLVVAASAPIVEASTPVAIATKPETPTVVAATPVEPVAAATPVEKPAVAVEAPVASVAPEAVVSSPPTEKSTIAAEAKSQEDLSPGIYFDAIKRRYTTTDNVCFDFTNKKFLVHLTKDDDTQKDNWGWNLVTNYQFEEFENGTAAITNSDWKKLSPDVTGLTCSD